MSEGDDVNDLNTPNPKWGNPEAGGQTPQYGARYNAPQHSEPPYNTSSAGVGGVPGGIPTYMGHRQEPTRRSNSQCRRTMAMRMMRKHPNMSHQ